MLNHWSHGVCIKAASVSQMLMERPFVFDWESTWGSQKNTIFRGDKSKMMGGKWNPAVKLWYIQYGKIKGTELEQHIILDALEKK